MPDLIRLESVTAARPGGAAVLRDLTWALRDGEAWAVVGPTGCGKTSFLELLLGRLTVTAGSISWPIVGRAGAAVPADVIRLVAFREDSRLFRPAGHYYQERFNFSDPLDEVAVGTFLRAGSAHPTRVYPTNSPPRNWGSNARRLACWTGGSSE